MPPHCPLDYCQEVLGAILLQSPTEGTTMAPSIDTQDTGQTDSTHRLQTDGAEELPVYPDATADASGEPDGASGNTVRFSAAPLKTGASGERVLSQFESTRPIGLGKPLSVRIASMFVGDAAYQESRNNTFFANDKVGEVLITSSVKNPMLQDAIPAAMHYHFNGARAGFLLRPEARNGGSDVVYYTPGMMHDVLQIDVRMSFDTFNAQKFEAILDQTDKIGKLPVFALTAPQGFAIATAASNVLRIAVKYIDGWIDNDNDWSGTWKLMLNEPNVEPATAGYTLFHLGHDDTANGWADKYQANKFDQTLELKTKPGEPVTKGDPYMLAMVNGASISELDGWTAAVVNAAVAQRFLDLQNTDPEDITSVLAAYNDIVMTQKIAGFDEDIAKGGEDIDKAKAKRDAAVKNIQAKNIRAMFPPATAP